MFGILVTNFYSHARYEVCEILNVEYTSRHYLVLAMSL